MAKPDRPNLVYIFTDQQRADHLGCYGNTVNQTLRDVRLTEAFRILSGHDTPSIKEVAYRTGFASPSYFTQCFKQQYGILPTEVNLRLSHPLKDALKKLYR